MLLIIAVFIYILYIFNSVPWSYKKIGNVIGFLFIGGISIFNIIADSRIISCNKFRWYFEFVFMCVAPLCQYMSEYYPWRVYLDESDIQVSIFIVILFDLTYTLFYNKKIINLKEGIVTNSIKSYLTRDKVYYTNDLVLLFIISIICFTVLVYMIGFYNLFFRSENSLSIENSTINFIIRKFLTAMPAMVIVIFISSNKKNKTFVKSAAIAILFVFTVCSNFPTSTTRYWMATILGGIFLNVFGKRTHTRIVDCAVIIGLSVIFPFFCIFKTMTITDLLAGNIKFSGIIDSYNTVDFDAFSMLVRTIRYVRENELEMGTQLINVLFFWVPRSIWITKPYPSGQVVAADQGQIYTNVSCPIHAEGYINFGVIGVLLYAFTFAKILRFFDNMYWQESSDDNINTINFIYAFLCIIIIYISRGALQPTVVQTFALVLPMIVINLFTAIQIKRKYNEK